MEWKSDREDLVRTVRYITFPLRSSGWHQNPLQNVLWQLRTTQAPSEWQRGKETGRRYATPVLYP